MKQQNEQPSVKDPVCGMELSRTTAVAESSYENKTYYFCADV
ncbi:MAG TPA: YHS domain-containing protein, partial [Gammaproteobacteria bacterium]|nr:YHS domain-containing protein [Gammaproteobacteria bacterium]